MNTVAEIGRLTRDVELQYTKEGEAFARFTLAVRSFHKKKDGTYETYFFNCVAWRFVAINLERLTKKGSLIGITGELKNFNYEKDGHKVYGTEIYVEKFNLLEKKDKGSEVVPVFETVDVKNEDLPF